MCTTNHAERLVLVLSSYLTEKPGVQILSPALFPRQLTKLSHLATLCMCIRQGNTNALTKTGRFKLLFLNLFLRCSWEHEQISRAACSRYLHPIHQLSTVFSKIKQAQALTTEAMAEIVRCSFFYLNRSNN